VIFKKLYLSIVCYIILLLPTSGKTLNQDTSITEQLYTKLKLSEIGLSAEAFACAMTGWNKIKDDSLVQNKDILSIIDFSQSSNAKRLYIIHLRDTALLYQSLVAHGKNSGEEFAQRFSNQANSYQSSLGFYITEKTYIGKHGLSLRLIGIENQYNGDAMERGIVMHGAAYVSESFIQQHGRLGRSEGCTAIPNENCETIINCIKNGTCLYIYYPNAQYMSASRYVNHSH
jgi:hypothetical protein